MGGVAVGVVGGVVGVVVPVAVAVAVRVGVSPPGCCTSTAPMSQRAPCGRGMVDPRPGRWWGFPH